MQGDFDDLRRGLRCPIMVSADITLDEVRSPGKVHGVAREARVPVGVSASNTPARLLAIGVVQVTPSGYQYDADEVGVNELVPIPSLPPRWPARWQADPGAQRVASTRSGAVFTVRSSTRARLPDVSSVRAPRGQS